MVEAQPLLTFECKSQQEREKKGGMCCFNLSWISFSVFCVSTLHTIRILVCLHAVRVSSDLVNTLKEMV